MKGSSNKIQIRRPGGSTASSGKEKRLGLCLTSVRRAVGVRLIYLVWTAWRDKRHDCCRFLWQFVSLFRFLHPHSPHLISSPLLIFVPSLLPFLPACDPSLQRRLPVWGYESSRHLRKLRHGLPYFVSSLHGRQLEWHHEGREHSGFLRVKAD